MLCKECGFELNDLGICENCGLCDDEHGEFHDEDFYPYDDEEVIHYGDPRGHGVSNIAVMTKVNIDECQDPDLKRALQWDTNYEWDIVKTEIINKSIKEACKKLGLNKKFAQHVFYFFRKIKNKDSTLGQLSEDFKLTGKLLEDIGVALVYLVARLDGIWNITLWDFEKNGYNKKKIYNYYTFFIKEFGLYKQVKRQRAETFVSKIINNIFPDNHEHTYAEKQALIQHVSKLFKACFTDLGLNNAMDIYTSYLPPLGACIYIYCRKHPHYNLTQSDICGFCGCTEVTLREYIKKAKQFSEIIESKSK